MRNWLVPVTLIAVASGVLIAAQFKSQAAYRDGLPSRRVEELVVMLKDAEAENGRLVSQVEALRESIKTAELPASGKASPVPGRLQATNGPGIEVEIADSAKPLTKGENPNIAIVHNEDLLKIVNELRASGAAALSVNDQRLVETSEISCAGPTILVNKTRLAPPFIIRAIGDADTMMAALALRGGVVEYLQFYGIQVNISRKPDIQVPMYVGGSSYQFAKPLTTKKST
ncbi:MAG: DUF881 domain-containing protein [Candidatus Sericytochromatia bacterium]|nr:DUF881 domain-containing protein [Candidatus Sericytochromatia bacterium]